MTIADELATAELHLSRAVAKIGALSGGGKRMPSGRLWLGVFADYKKCVKLMLAVRNLEHSVRKMETPKQGETINGQ